MEPTVLESLALTEQDQVERWRTRELERVGFDIALARRLARRLDVDLHQALDLIDRGCPPELAARILL
jgi:ABC-type amino acid transport substrate-binding protein